MGSPWITHRFKNSFRGFFGFRSLQGLPSKRHAKSFFIQHVPQLDDFIILPGDLLLELVELQLHMPQLFRDVLDVFGERLGAFPHLIFFLVGVVLLLLTGFQINVEKHLVQLFHLRSTFWAVLRPLLPLQDADFVKDVTAN